MKKVIWLSGFIVLFVSFGVNAQTRKAVGAAEVTGTFRSYFGGKYKGNYQEIEILSVGRGKLNVAFHLTYPYTDGTGEFTANTGEASGTAAIKGDTAVYSSDAFGQCRITIKFVKPGEIKVTQSGADTDCGFGHNVSADGAYKKTSRVKPKFDIN